MNVLDFFGQHGETVIILLIIATAAAITINSKYKPSEATKLDIKESLEYRSNTFLMNDRSKSRWGEE